MTEQIEQPRYTFVWWGDGYAVYDGETYIGKDDQLSEIQDIIVPSGLGRIVDAEAHEDLLNEHWGAPLSEFLTALREAGGIDD